MNRKEHMQWCKKRAMEYVDSDDLSQAVASMMSDIRKHESTEDFANSPTFAFLGMAGMMDAQRGDKQAVIRWIQGFAE